MTDGALSKDLQATVLGLRKRIQSVTDASQQDINDAGLITHSPLLASLLPPEQIAYYRQLLKLGSNLSLIPPTDNSIQETQEQHSLRIKQTLADAFSDRKAAADFIKNEPRQQSQSLHDRASYWPEFEKQVAEEDVLNKRISKNLSKTDIRPSIGFSECPLTKCLIFNP